ncbi:hypothetical protein Cgig2_030724 [Carnegiea gigantea]|uniref:Uncharacterized protein n=1 Tax=Carnegiea gigantea TaxID=171969 RepID=A0A9Q1JP16_9CARY|nr:hypothetical protein Cgig2_030724 [Carnegiea gigantea]
MDVVSSMRPLPTFDYIPTARSPAESQYRSNEIREVIQLERNGWSHEKKHDYSTVGGLPGSPRGNRELRDCAHTLSNPFPVQGLVQRVGANLKASGKSLSSKAHSRVPFSSRAHTGLRSLHKDHNSAYEEPREEECSTAIAATITEDMRALPLLRGRPRCETMEQENRITVLTMTLDGQGGS